MVRETLQLPFTKLHNVSRKGKRKGLWDGECEMRDECVEGRRQSSVKIRLGNRGQGENEELKE